MASTLLGALVVAAPILAGGWRVELLPAFALLASAAWLAVVVHRWQDGRTISVPLAALVFALLAAATALQAVPVGDLLSYLSPRASEVRDFVAPLDRRTVTYEVGATWREAAKMMLYALVVAVAHELARRRGSRRVLVPIVVAVVGSVLVALLHRALRIDALFGLFEGPRAAWTRVTTFQNPNHASAFLTLGALVATGLALESPRRTERLAYLGAGASLAGLSVVDPSKGGIVSLVLGLALFGFLLWRKGGDDSDRVGLPLLLAVLVLPLAGVVWRLDDVLRELGLLPGATFGLVEKLAAVRDAAPIVEDHPWVGIGRGAYISVYPQYQSSALQLTFAFPENLVAQLVAEWGIPVGGAALLGLVGAVLARIMRATKPHEMGAAAGLAAMVAHDLVDFSLEMPGVAIVCAVLLGALAPKAHGVRYELRVGTGIPALALVLLPVVLTALFIVGALRGGDLRADVAWLEVQGRAAAAGASVDVEEVRRRADRHPANVLVAAQVAYIQEVRTPPDPKGALQAVNRALFLGPRYADAHVLAGRLLLASGHRRQAFSELRIAWGLTGGRDDVMGTARAWARSTEELLSAVPRSDPVFDVLEPRQVLRLTGALVGAGDVATARAILPSLPGLEAMEPDDLELLARLASSAGAPELALRAAHRSIALRPSDARPRLTLAQLHERQGRLDEAWTEAARVPLQDPGLVVELLELQLRIALARVDGPAAREVLERLRRHLPPTRENQVGLALREARIDLALERPDRAVGVLGRALDWVPGDLEVRLLRASALERIGRRAEARVDAEFVLRRDPNHQVAKNLVDRLSVQD